MLLGKSIPRFSGPQTVRERKFPGEEEEEEHSQDPIDFGAKIKPGQQFESQENRKRIIYYRLVDRDGAWLELLPPPLSTFTFSHRSFGGTWESALSEGT